MLSLDIPAEVNAAEWIVDRNVVEGRRDRTAIYFEGDTWTFGDFQALVNRTGNVLRELGVEIENRVGLLMLDTPEYLAAFMGAVKIGAVPICLNTLLGAGAHEYMLNDSARRPPLRTTRCSAICCEFAPTSGISGTWSSWVARQRGASPMGT